MMKSLRVVQVRAGGNVKYSLRSDGSDGIETEIATFDSREMCEQFKTNIAALTNDEQSSELMIISLLGTLFEIADLAELIMKAVEEQGNAGYATKHHMASWGTEIHCKVSCILNGIGLKKPSD